MTPGRLLARWWQRSPVRGIALTASFGRRGARFHPTSHVTGRDTGLELGRGASVGSRCAITVGNTATLTVEALAWISDDCVLETWTALRIGRGTTVQRRTTIIGSVSIGPQCVIAPNVFISSGSHLVDRWPHAPIRVQERWAGTDLPDAPIVIGDDCWLGANVVVAPGCTIGRGCVIGANSVVTSDLPPYAVAVGAPARVVRRRLDWQPPSVLDASDPRAAPYFEDGFAIEWGDRPADPIKVPWPQRGTVMLGRRGEGDQVLVALHSAAAGRVVVGGVEQLIASAGRHVVEGRGRDAGDGVLLVELGATSPAPGGATVLRIEHVPNE
jgi:acetyltransferase-like isoleucine patch superfamily enzyme